MGLSKDKRVIFIASVIVISLGILGADTFVPSLPALAVDLSTTAPCARLTLSAYLLGFGFLPMVIGPLSDRFGRRQTLIIWLLIGLFASVFALFVADITALIVARFVQGAGVAAGVTITRSSSSDLFERKELAQFGSYLGMTIAFVPAVAPLIGGYLQAWYGWRANFIFFCTLSIFAIVYIICQYPETNLSPDRQALNPKVLLRNNLVLLTRKSFITFPLCASCAFSGVMVYFALSPFLLQSVLKLTSVEYGWSSVAIGLTVILGSLLNMRLLSQVAIIDIMVGSSLLMLVSTVFMLLSGLFGYLTLWVILLSAFGYFLGVRFILSNVFAMGMKNAAGRLGVASALFTTIQMGGSAIVNVYASYLNTHNQVAMAALMFALSLTCCFLLLSYKYSVTSLKSVDAQNPMA